MNLNQMNWNAKNGIVFFYLRLRDVRELYLYSTENESVTTKPNRLFAFSFSARLKLHRRNMCSSLSLVEIINVWYTGWQLSPLLLCQKSILNLVLPAFSPSSPPPPPTKRQQNPPEVNKCRTWLARCFAESDREKVCVFVAVVAIVWWDFRRSRSVATLSFGKNYTANTSPTASRAFHSVSRHLDVNIEKYLVYWCKRARVRFIYSCSYSVCRSLHGRHTKRVEEDTFENLVSIYSVYNRESGLCENYVFAYF